jgi:Leucine-rich repeat (LRR) protein
MLLSSTWHSQRKQSTISLHKALLVLLLIFPAGLTAQVHTSIKKATKDWQNCFSLDLTNQEIGKDYPKIGELRYLSELKMGGNNVDTLPREIGNLTAMTRFVVKDNPLRVLPPDIKGWGALNTLELEKTKLDSFPMEIAYLGRLQHCILRNNDATEKFRLPESFGYLNKLKSLEITDSPLDTLPDTFTALEGLESLAIQGCGLDCLPKEIGKMKKLESLTLTNNALTEIPNSISYCRNLEYLSFRDNQLTKLTENVSNLTKLSTLDLRGNAIDPHHLDVLKALLPGCTVLHD